MKTYKTRILATGSTAPDKILTNEDLTKMVDTSDEWIRERTGISERRIIDPKAGECNSELALKATRLALEKANLKPTDLEFILYATVTPDYVMPTTSCILQQKLGAGKIPSLDISAACSGFVYGVSIANSFIKSGVYKKILLIGSDVLSAITNWEDRNSCILFGDASGAVILGRGEENQSSDVYSCHLYADGDLQDFFTLHAGGTKLPASHETVDKKLHLMQMKGREIFKVAVRMLADCAVEALEKNGFQLKDLDWFIPHQANLRIIEAVAKRLDFPMEKVIVNLKHYGNTSSATIPTAFDQAVTAGKIKRGDLVLFDAFGAGLTYGSALLRY